MFIVTTFILISGMRHLDGTFNVAFFTLPNQNSFLTRTKIKTEWIEACERSVSNGQQPIIPCEDLRSRYMELVVANLVFGAVSFVLNVSFAVQL